MKKLILLGSTGSIGTQCLDVVRDHPECFQVVGLAAGNRWSDLGEQAREFGVRDLAILDQERADLLARSLPGSNHSIRIGVEGMVDLVENVEADVVVVATAGSLGLRPTLAALEAGREIALANKEVLVMAGDLVIRKAREKGVPILPIDSEHSAVFQCLACGRSDEVERIYITASGGPFREWPIEKIATATPEFALRHPTWSMGTKVTIDSATMLNKGFEVIECHHLFGIAPEKISVVIHPQSIVHSMVEFCDGSILAHLGKPDMRIPIRYALSHPRRFPRSGSRLDPLRLGSLEFGTPDYEKFPCLRLAREALEAGGSAPAVLSAAGEAAVTAFIAERIRFGGIASLIERALDEQNILKEPSLEELLEIEETVRAKVSEWVERI